MHVRQIQIPTTQTSPIYRSQHPQVPALQPLTANTLLALRFDLIAEHAVRWFARRRTRATVRNMSARQYEDAGFYDRDIEQVIAQAVDVAREQRLHDKRLARARRLAVKRTRNELMALDSRELDDIGICRHDIERIAQAARANVADVLAANPKTNAAVKSMAANDLRKSAAA